MSQGAGVAFNGDLRRPGGQAEFSLADAAVLDRMHDALPAAAAALSCAAMTAYQAAVRRLR